jgi:cysteinyl-tRNA synthetase
MGEHLAQKADQIIRRLGQVLGLDFQATRRGQIHSAEGRSAGTSTTIGISSAITETMSDAEIATLVEARNAARARRDWAAADAIRKQLAGAGVTIEDRPDGTTRIKR